MAGPRPAGRRGPKARAAACEADPDTDRRSSGDASRAPAIDGGMQDWRPAALPIGHPASGFAPFAVMTSGKASIGKENRLAERLVADGDDLPLKIQAREDLLRQLGARSERSRAASTARPLPAFRPRLHRLRHHCRQRLRPEAELLVQRHVLRALRKGEEPRLADAPRFEQRHRRLEQALADAAFPAIGPHCDRAEDAEAAPARREARADQLLAAKGAERRRGVRPPPRLHEVRVAAERHRLGQAELGAESETEHPVGRGEIAFEQRANGDLHSPPAALPGPIASTASRCASFAAGMPQYIAISSRTSRISSALQPLASAPRTCTPNSAGRLSAAVMPSTTRLRILWSSPGRLQMSP